MMGVELVVQVFLDSALLSACVFGTLGWQGRLMNCVLAGNFVICLLSRLTGYSTDPVSCCPAGQFRLCIIPAFSRTPFE